MSATQRLKAQLSTQATVSLALDFNLRNALKEALTKSGKFTDIRIKYDSRRDHLNLFVRATGQAKSIERVVDAAARQNLSVTLSLVTANYTENTYRVTGLSLIKSVGTTAVAPVKVKPAASKLTTAVKADTAPAPQPKVAVYLNYDRLGYVSQSLAKQIRQLVESENKPKFADVTVVDLKTSAKVTITVPFDVAAAVKAQVPSFNQLNWTIKSTHGISILKQDAGTPTEKTWVIA
jgi:hypothetical protein